MKKEEIKRIHVEQLKMEKYGENVARVVLAENLSHNCGNNLEFNL